MTDQKPCTCGSKEMSIFMADRDGFVCLQCDGIRPHSNEWRERLMLEALRRMGEARGEKWVE